LELAELANHSLEEISLRATTNSTQLFTGREQVNYSQKRPLYIFIKSSALQRNREFSIAFTISAVGSSIT
jgi:hypothetical protein